MVHLFKKRNQKSTPISGRALAGIVLIGRESVGVVWFICGLLRKVWCRCKRWILDTESNFRTLQEVHRGGEIQIE